MSAFDACAAFEACAALEAVAALPLRFPEKVVAVITWKGDFI